MSEKTTGRFAVVDGYEDTRAISLIFETEDNLTGEYTATVNVLDIDSIQEINVGDTEKAAFDDRTVLTFDGNIEARKKAPTSLEIGHYSGRGKLTKTSNCDFEFTSNLFPGIWRIYKNKELKITRLK